MVNPQWKVWDGKLDNTGSAVQETNWVHVYSELKEDGEEHPVLIYELGSG